MDGNYGQNQNWQDQNQGQTDWNWQDQSQSQLSQGWQDQSQNQQNQNWQNPNQNAYYNGYNNGQPGSGYPNPNMPNQGYVNNNGYNNYAPNGYNGPIVVTNAVPPKSGGLAVGSLVCGIITIICFWSVVTIIAAIVGIVLGAVNNAQDNPNKGMAVAGIILNVLSIFLTIAFIVILMEL